MAKAKKAKRPVSKTHEGASRGNGGGDAEQLTTVQEPPVPDPDRAEYTPPEAKERAPKHGEVDPNAQPREPDKIWEIASRDRWNAESDADAKQRQDDARAAEASAAANREE